MFYISESDLSPGVISVQCLLCPCLAPPDRPVVLCMYLRILPTFLLRTPRIEVSAHLLISPDFAKAAPYK